MGRLSKLTPQVQRKIVEAIKKGAYVEVAAQYAGIDQSTFHRWVNRGLSTSKADAPYRKFREAVEKAETQTEIMATARVLEAGKENWGAAMTWLERKYPQRWGRKDRLELVGESLTRFQAAVVVAIGIIAKEREDEALPAEFARALRESAGGQ